MSNTHIYVLQTISKRQAKKTQESIIKHNPAATVVTVKNPYGFEGTDGCLAIPQYHGDCESNILIVTDQMVCNANLDCVISSNSSPRDSLDLTLNFSHNKNICWYRFDGADDLDPCYLLNTKNLTNIRANKKASNMFSDNCDFGNLFSYKNEKKAKVKEESFSGIKLKKKKRWWFR